MLRWLHSAVSFAPPGIGINAQLLSTGSTYRAAGTSRYLASLLPELSQALSPQTLHVYLSRRHVPAKLAESSAALHRTALPTWRPAVRIIWEQFCWPILLRRHGVTLAHGPAHALPLAWTGPSVLTVHDLSFLVDPTTFRSANQRYLRAAVRLSARRATRIVAVSEWTRKDVVRLLGADPAKVEVVYEGVEDRFRPLEPTAVAEFRERNGLPAEYVLYLGTIEPRKNLVRLLDAYALIRERGIQLPLVIAGALGPGGRPVVDHAANLGLDRDVRFVGFVPEEEKPLWYNSARFFVFPSQYEGFGLPVLEAFACGTPVITSNRSSLPEVAGDAGLLVNPSDTHALADAMQRLSEDASLLRDLSRAGREQALRFSWRTAAQQMAAVYGAALESY